MFLVGASFGKPGAFLFVYPAVEGLSFMTIAPYNWFACH